MTDYEQHTEQELLDLYNQAKEAYYGTEEPIMTDVEFDNLEQYLIAEYDLQKHVGMLTETGKKIKHWNQMLSLAKVKIGDDGFTDENKVALEKHLKSSNDIINYRISVKLDGLAMDCSYSKGKLLTIATRGTGEQGADVTEKFRSRVPETIDIKDDISIRVECCMSKQNFEKHYASQYTHARNLVSGIKNDLNPNDPRLKHVDLIAVDAIYRNGIVVSFDDIKKNTGFQIVEFVTFNNFSEIKKIYEDFNKRRSSIDYPNDGLVVFRNILNEIRTHNGHDPKDVIAIKFPPEKFTTTVKGIYWALSKHGKYIPVVLLNPVRIDGRMIGKVSGYNYSNVKSLGISIGAIVEIAIMGDIIPAVKSVIKPSTVELTIPLDAVVDGVHLKATGSEEKMHRARFIAGVITLEFDGIGSSGVGNLFDTISNKGIKDFDYTEIFKPYVDENYLLCIGNSASKKMFKRILAIKKEGIQLRKVIQALGLTGLGESMSIQVARYYSNLEPDWFGLEKKIIESSCNGEYSIAINKAINSLKASAVILHLEEEKKVIANEFRYMLTGSPKNFGFKTKEEFKSTLPSNWVEVDNLKQAHMLITDDMASISSKMKSAQQLKLKIQTYGDKN
jgi:DNA ligase (NAD+)